MVSVYFSTIVFSLLIWIPYFTPTVSKFDVPGKTVEELVLLTEKDRFRAMVNNDLSTLEMIISDDLVYIHSNGSVDNKTSFIAAIKNGTRSYDDITMEETKVRVYDSVGIINGKCTYHRRSAEGTPNNLTLLYTSVYVLVSEKWRHVSWQSFKISE